MHSDINLTDIEKEEARHPAGGLAIPINLNTFPALKVPANNFQIPRTIYCMDYFLKSKDQGSKPWCAGYAAAAFLENILWRIDDAPHEIDPTWIYQWAKQNDGMPTVEGTTLTAALGALLDSQYFPPECRVKVLNTKEQVQYALHKYGCCLLGLNISREWYACNKNKTAIYGQSGCDVSLVGGHAVASGGMCEDGIYVLNSWGEDWSSYGRVLLSWKEFDRQFLYGAVIDNCLVDIHMN